VVAAYFALVTDAVLSTSEPGSHGTPLLTGQLIVAIVGLLPAGLLAPALDRRDDLQAVVWLVIAIVVYLAWGVLNDASVHGWSNLQVF
jgi:hypothetical protein